MSVLTNKTILELWSQEVKRAEELCSTRLVVDVEAYLVYLLMRFTNRPEIISQIVTTNFLETLKQGLHQRELGLQHVGDQCLLLSGLFPHIAEKRRVTINFFVGIGRSAYKALSYRENDLYASLSKQFVTIMDVLQSMRCYSKQCPDLLPLEAYDLWQSVGSQRALRILKTYTRF